MERKYLILIDEQSQEDTLKSIKKSLKNDGIDLIYKELNPVNSLKRAGDGNLYFNEVDFKKSLEDIDFFKFADKILCDYNLIADVVTGYDIIKLIRELGYNKNKQIILYSAEIGGVIKSILLSDDNFEKQKEALVKLVGNNIDFINRPGYDQEVIKAIKKNPEFDFESELIKWFHNRNNDTFNYLFPKYQGKSFGEIAFELESKTSDSIQFKKDLIEQIIAYLVTINELENA